MIRYKSIAFLILLLASMNAGAQTRTEAQAREEAAAFFSKNATRSVDADDIQLLRTGDRNTFYIYGNEPGGFVIISSKESTETVLGYSSSTRLDGSDLPPAMEAWLENLASHVQNSPNEKYSAATKSDTEKILQTANWNQQSPFNDKCPEYAPAGCTAVSMAIVLRYLQWPDAGTGTLPAYSYEDIHKKTHSVDSLALGHTYEWESMPLEGVTKDNADQIATIIRDCGIMIQSMYSYTDNGTSAYNENILPALKKYMKYDASGVLSYAKCSGSAEWKEAVISQINDSIPLIYSGQSAELGGHSFVVDGYDGEGRFHINWGWGGDGNGFFTFPEFGDFTQSHNAIFGLKKDEGGTQSDNILVEDMMASTEKFTKDTSFTVSFTVYNISDADFTGQLEMARITDGGEFKEFISEEISPEEPIEASEGIAYRDVKCTIRGDIGIGDLITLTYKGRSGEWKQCSYDHDNPLSAMISISSAAHLDESTSFRYDRKAGSVTLDTKANTSCSVNPEVNIEKKDNSFILSGFTHGTYTVRLQCGMELFSFNLVL